MFGKIAVHITKSKGCSKSATVLACLDQSMTQVDLLSHGVSTLVLVGVKKFHHQKSCLFDFQPTILKGYSLSCVTSNIYIH